ncbi:MAG: glycosyltransferase [Planctomycetota bacterium]|nr:glycosyltransferase [Planctomycetota bacterium]MDA1025856.1 glycosyltransferase [Planctomycetota bacterium]
MKISAFTFLRNPVRLGYPFIESIRSALPLVDEYVIALGESTDGTREAIEAIGDKRIRIIDTQWNGSTGRGFVYGQQKMIGLFNTTGAWSLYLEGDEVLHERDIEGIRELAERADRNPRVEAIAFRYHHFYGTPDQVATGPAWYRVEPRMVRNHDIRVIAPGGLYFVVMDKNKKGRYPRAVETDATVHHYGWVRPVESHDEKARQVSPYWGKHVSKGAIYENVDPTILKPFEGTHPEVMKGWLETSANHEFTVNPEHRLTTRERRQRVKRLIEGFTGLDLCKRHHRKVRL